MASSGFIPAHHLLHRPLESSRCIGQSLQHHLELPISKKSGKGCLRFIALHLDLIVAAFQVQHMEPFGSSKKLKVSSIPAQSSDSTFNSLQPSLRHHSSSLQAQWEKHRRYQIPQLCVLQLAHKGAASDQKKSSGDTQSTLLERHIS